MSVVFSPLCGNVEEDHFLLILHSQGWQTNNPALYGEKFLGEKYESTCLLQVIRPKSAPLCQPYNACFYRKVKNYTAKSELCPVFVAELIM
jgi:hypothetical protein